MERARRSPEPVIRMVAHTRNHAQLVADLHTRALSVSGATQSVMLELDGRRRHLRPTSGTGFADLPGEPWIELPDSLALVFEVLASGHPRQVAPLILAMPDLSLRLGTAAAIVAPVLARGEALGVLVLAVAAVVPALEWMDQVAACADAFALVLARTRLEAEWTALRERLAQSEAISHLVAGIAHELNNPLQGVLGHLELLRRTAAVPAALDDPLRQIYREADRAARIVRNLLLLAGSGRLALRAVSVNRALTKALGLRAAACRQHGITVHREIAAGLPRVQGDAILLQQAFLNVLVNAEQALAATRGGRIDVRSAVEGGRVVVEIRDNGPGLDAEVAQRVFDPFFTTRAAGSGLGLALTRRIVAEHGGDITAGNTPEGGAVFRVSLPPHSMVT